MGKRMKSGTAKSDAGPTIHHSSKLHLLSGELDSAPVLAGNKGREREALTVLALSEGVIKARPRAQVARRRAVVLPRPVELVRRVLRPSAQVLRLHVALHRRPALARCAHKMKGETLHDTEEKKKKKRRIFFFFLPWQVGVVPFHSYLSQKSMAEPDG